MDDFNEPDIDDIDAFLSADATGNTPAGPPAAGDKNLPPTAEGASVKRLECRLAHAERSLTSALFELTSLTNALEPVADDTAAFDADIDAWDRSIGRLEQTLTRLPTWNRVANKPDGAVDDGEPHEDIADAVARELDEAVAVQSVDQSPPVADLLETLKTQEDRIRELESRLAAGQESVPAETPDPYVNRLVVAMNGLENLKYPISRNMMTIGRDPDNDIQIRSRYVSRHHARIVCDAHGAVIEDLGSRNGVSVNNVRIRRQQLRSGDLIDLGKFQLKYIDLMEGSSSEGRA